MKVNPSTKVPDPMGIFVPEDRSTQPNGYICTRPANKEKGPLPSISSNNYDFSQFTYKILPVYGKICSSYV